MSGETEKDTSGWTVDTSLAHLRAMMGALEKRIDQRFDQTDKSTNERFVAQDLAVRAALAASEKAKEVAEGTNESWRENANEWRGAMDDRERNLMPRKEGEQADKDNAKQLDALAARLDKSEGFTRGLLMVFAVIAALGTLVGILIVTLKK